jgi:hypothetical protein
LVVVVVVMELRRRRAVPVADDDDDNDDDEARDFFRRATTLSLVITVEEGIVDGRDVRRLLLDFTDPVSSPDVDIDRFFGLGEDAMVALLVCDVGLVSSWIFFALVLNWSRRQRRRIGA